MPPLSLKAAIHNVPSLFSSFRKLDSIKRHYATLLPTKDIKEVAKLLCLRHLTETCLFTGMPQVQPANEGWPTETLVIPAEDLCNHFF